MKSTVRELAELVNGQVLGEGGLEITGARPLDSAQLGDITFVENDRHAARLQGSQASAVVVPLTFAVNGRPPSPSFILVADPLNAFVTIVRHLQGRGPHAAQGVDPLASIHPTARLGEGCAVYPFARVGEGSVVGPRCELHSGAVIGRHCRVGADVVLYPNVVLYDGTVLGDRVIVHANAVLGADGFGYRTQQGRHVKVPQLGHVEVGDDVEIGAGTTIDRGTFQATRVGAGTKIDNLVQIGHNCQIGRHNLLVAQVGIAGSCKTGDYVVMAGQVGVSDHVEIGDRSVIGGKAGVARDIPADARMLGTPATPEGEQKRIMLSLAKLPELCRDVRLIKQRLGGKDE